MIKELKFGLLFGGFIVLLSGGAFMTGVGVTSVIQAPIVFYQCEPVEVEITERVATAPPSNPLPAGTSVGRSAGVSADAARAAAAAAGGFAGAGVSAGAGSLSHVIVPELPTEEGPPR